MPAKFKVDMYPAGRTLRQGIDRAFVGISLRNGKINSSARLMKSFRWTTDNVGQFDLLVGDYLNRHNYEAFDNMPKAAASKLAISEGIESLARLKKLLTENRSFGSVEVICASSLAGREEFQSRLNEFHRHYAENWSFSHLIDEGVYAFMSRVHPSAIGDRKSRSHCVAYQLEELVMFEMLYGDGKNVLVYAGSQLPVMKGFVSGAVPGVSEALQRLTLIELRQFEDY